MTIQLLKRTRVSTLGFLRAAAKPVKESYTNTEGTATSLTVNSDKSQPRLALTSTSQHHDFLDK